MRNRYAGAYWDRVIVANVVMLSGVVTTDASASQVSLPGQGSIAASQKELVCLIMNPNKPTSQLKVENSLALAAR